MTKKHFDKIARCFLVAMEAAAGRAYQLACIARLVESFADTCQEENGRFDRARFYDACGLLPSGMVKPVYMPAPSQEETGARFYSVTMRDGHTTTTNANNPVDAITTVCDVHGAPRSAVLSVQEVKKTKTAAGLEFQPNEPSSPAQATEHSNEAAARWVQFQWLNMGALESDNWRSFAPCYDCNGLGENPSDTAFRTINEAREYGQGLREDFPEDFQEYDYRLCRLIVEPLES